MSRIQLGYLLTATGLAQHRAHPRPFGCYHELFQQPLPDCDGKLAAPARGVAFRVEAGGYFT